MAKFKTYSVNTANYGNEEANEAYPPFWQPPWPCESFSNTFILRVVCCLFGFCACVCVFLFSAFFLFAFLLLLFALRFFFFFGFCFTACWLNNVGFFFFSLFDFFSVLFVLSQWLEDVVPPQFSVVLPKDCAAQTHHVHTGNTVLNPVRPIKPVRQQLITEVFYTLFSIKTKT